MAEIFSKIIVVITVFYAVRFLYNKLSNNKSNKEKPFPNKKKQIKRDLPYDDEAIKWCANFLSLDKPELEEIFHDGVYYMYDRFRIKKRSGGHRGIARPYKKLMSIQKTIYNRILSQVNIHPAATGFRKGISIIDNAKQHLGKDDIIKTDIVNFFYSIQQDSVEKAFEKIGYPGNISKVLAELCCLNNTLPQGAPTSPALSNIISYEMDKKFAVLSYQHGLIYTRYADDLTFSGNNINPGFLLPAIKKIVNEEGFAVKLKKTRYINRRKRKIITGISISSGKKLTIPKAKKREIRKNVYFILTKGLVEHQKYIKSKDPVYLKRLICYLSFWKMVEPENKYVINSIASLKKIQAKNLPE
ncbi:MAG: reverse transcriptase family protein [Tannerella sp.]|jgi:retron-type reverse transcriptase|nr:reverse transcriptase family protein [Tannerella sp.]